jgi:hypothetical protein
MSDLAEGARGRPRGLKREETRQSLARGAAAPPGVLPTPPARDATRRDVSPLSSIDIAGIAHPRQRRKRPPGRARVRRKIGEGARSRDPYVVRTPKTLRIQHPSPLINAAVVRQRSGKTRQPAPPWHVREVIPGTWHAKFVGCLGGKQGNFYAVLALAIPFDCPRLRRRLKTSASTDSAVGQRPAPRPRTVSV